VPFGIIATFFTRAAPSSGATSLLSEQAAKRSRARHGAMRMVDSGR
jgi:hypothetical protein